MPCKTTSLLHLQKGTFLHGAMQEGQRVICGSQNLPMFRETVMAAQVEGVVLGAEHLSEEAVDAAAHGITDTLRGVTGVAKGAVATLLHAIRDRRHGGSCEEGGRQALEREE